MKHKTNIVDLFAQSKLDHEYLKICAPMVRYSKLEFRTLVRKYGVDLCFTPMIMADSFCQSNKARLNEFTTSMGKNLKSNNYLIIISHICITYIQFNIFIKSFSDDIPLIAQFASKNVVDFVSGSEMIFPYVDGVDLNCGCPQRWAMSDGYGSAMLNSPEIIKDIILGIRRNFPSEFSVSIKIRLLPAGLEPTIELCRQLEKCGAAFLTVHGRTCHEKVSVPVNKLAIKDIKDSLQIPIVANGDVWSLTDANEFHEITGCDGVMSARGILANPGLYAGHAVTPLECVQDWTNLCYESNTNITFQCFHHHLTFMMEKIMNKSSRIMFNNLTKKEQVFEFLENEYNIIPNVKENQKSLYDKKSIACEYDDTKYRDKVFDESLYYKSEATKGKFFSDKIKVNTKPSKNNADDGGLDFMDTSIFDD